MADFLLQENPAGYILQEDGLSKILLEQQAGTVSPPIPPPAPAGASGILDSINPTFVVSSEQQINITIEKTQAQLADQGFTYNQPGFTYNQPGWQYGGVYNQNQDLSPIFTNDTATLLTPVISSIINVDTHPIIPATDSKSLLPIGLPFYFLTYP